MHLSVLAWNDISQATIANSLHHAGFNTDQGATEKNDLIRGYQVEMKGLGTGLCRWNIRVTANVTFQDLRKCYMCRRNIGSRDNKSSSDARLQNFLKKLRNVKLYLSLCLKKSPNGYQSCSVF